MSDITYKNYTTDQILFIGYRIPTQEIISSTSTSKEMPGTYFESIVITSLDKSQISGCSLYEDLGVSEATTQKSIRFIVSSATGKYENFKCFEIIYNNDNYTRIVNFYKEVCL
jgi:hypothetical protein